MSQNIQNELNQALNWRYATKQFDTNKKIDAQTWQTIENSLVLSPSSYGLQPWRFLLVQNPEVRQQLRQVSWNQSQVTDCSHYLVLCYKEKMDQAHIEAFLQRTATVRGSDLSKMDGYKNVMLGDLVNGPRAKQIDTWAQRQTYIAMGFAMEAAALLKVDTCALEGLDPQAYDKILNLESTTYKTVAAIAFGYRHDDDKYQNLAKVRFEAKDVIFKV